jgi:D-alanyl-D-alanine carboxypeptidase
MQPKEGAMLLVKTVLIAGALAATGLTSPSAAAGAPQPRLQRIVDQLVRDGAPGAVAVVRTPSGVVRVQSGLARRRPRLAMAATDRFRVASMTKSFVATVVLQLVAEGRLRLDDTVERWLPGLVPGGAEITIRQLLDHTSGIFDYYDDARFVRAVIARPGRHWPPRTLVGIATRHRPVFPPGKGWSYSNTNFVVLGLVVEAATGTAVRQQLEQRVIRPLRLRETSFPAGRRIDGPHADGYIGFATLPRLRSLLDVTSVVSPSFAWTAGGIVSSADDITRFYSALLAGRLLPPALLEAMKTPAPTGKYGLGLEIVDTACGRAYGHDGIAPGYRGVAYASADGSRVVLVTVNVDETFVAQSELDAAAERALCSPG